MPRLSRTVQSAVETKSRGTVSKPQKQRLFVLECEQSFQRERKAWGQGQSESAPSSPAATAATAASSPVAAQRVFARRSFRLLSLARADPQARFRMRFVSHSR